MSLSEQLTYSTVRLICSDDDGNTSLGTGFIMAFCQRNDKNIPVVVTNYHVVSGYTKFQFEFCLKKDDGKPDDLNICKVILSNIGWLHHPNKNIDLCCLLLAQILKEEQEKGTNLFYIPLDMNCLPSDEIMNELTAMEEVVMVGYPVGLIDDFNHKPIIRRGITATHIRKKYCGKNEFLIDMACFPGSSGSPVCILNEGTYLSQGAICVGTRFLLVGILYGGPQYDAKGNIFFSNVPTVKTQIPTNLGLVIRSDELRLFESLFDTLLKIEEPSKNQTNSK